MIFRYKVANKMICTAPKNDGPKCMIRLYEYRFMYKLKYYLIADHPRAEICESKVDISSAYFLTTD